MFDSLIFSIVLALGKLNLQLCLVCAIQFILNSSERSIDMETEIVNSSSKYFIYFSI